VHVVKNTLLQTAFRRFFIFGEYNKSHHNLRTEGILHVEKLTVSRFKKRQRANYAAIRKRHSI